MSGNHSLFGKFGLPWDTRFRVSTPDRSSSARTVFPVASEGPAQDMCCPWRIPQYPLPRPRRHRRPHEVLLCTYT